MTAILISTAAPRPSDLADGPAIHQNLLDDLNREANAVGWLGTTIEDYAATGGCIVLTVAPGEWPATIEDLRKFREDQKLREEEFRMTGRLI